MSLINVTVSGSTLVKTGGCDGCADATAVSQQQVTGTGAITFTAAEADTLRLVGFGSGGVGTAAGDINFALRLQAGVLEVRESGAYRVETSFSAGDTFRIAIDRGVVTYWKNGALFYTSSVQAPFALRARDVDMAPPPLSVETSTRRSRFGAPLRPPAPRRWFAPR
jgi:hypothetical protein